LALTASHLTKDEEKRNPSRGPEKELNNDKHFGIPISEEQVNKMFGKFDANEDDHTFGEADYSEFLVTP